MNYNTKTIRDALSVAQGVSQELMHDAQAALAELERAAKEPVAWMRKWAFDGEAPTKEVNSRGRMALAFRFKLLEVTRGKCLPDDVALYTTQPPAQPAPGMPEWYGMDTPWPLHDVLAKLIEATGVLLDRHNYCDHGHEGVRYAQLAGKEILANIFKDRTP